MDLGCLFNPGPCLSGIGPALETWFWGTIAGWPLWLTGAVALAVVGFAYRQAGWPGVMAVVFGYGVLWGRHTAQDESHEHVDGPDAVPPPPRPRKRKTLVDLFRRK